MSCPVDSRPTDWELDGLLWALGWLCLGAGVVVALVACGVWMVWEKVR